MSRISAVIEDETLKPIMPPDHLFEAAPKLKRDLYSQLVFGLAVILGIAAILASAVAFAGFAENDTGIVHLLSAFLLCFGIGALAFGPLGLIAIYARKAVTKPMTRSRAWIVILLILPWFPLCYFLWPLGDIIRYLAVVTALSGLFFLAWAARFLNAK